MLDRFDVANVVDRRILLLFAHVLTTERIYLERPRGLDPWPQNFWLELSLPECAARVAENRLQYENFFAVLTKDDLELAVKYHNSKSVKFQTPIKDLLTHVTLHGAYHRSQLAGALMAAGREPVNTDFIAFIREDD